MRDMRLENDAARSDRDARRDDVLQLFDRIRSYAEVFERPVYEG